MSRKVNEKQKMRHIVYMALKNIGTVVRLYPKMIRMSKHLERYSVEERYEYGMKVIDAVLEKWSIKINAIGLENIPETDGIYICANHQDKFDVLAMWASFPRQLSIVAADEACHKPLVRELVRMIESKLLVKGDMRSMLQITLDIAERLKAGINYLIFPEGRYEEKVTELMPFMAGCFKSPQKAESPILPVAIIDSCRIFDGISKPPYNIEVHYLEPIMPEAFAGMKTKEISEMVKSRIQEAVDTFQTPELCQAD